MAGPLDHIERRREERVAGEGEHDTRDMDRPQAPEGGVFREVQRREGQLERDEEPRSEADERPDDGGQHEPADDLLVIAGNGLVQPFLNCRRTHF